MTTPASGLPPTDEDSLEQPARRRPSRRAWMLIISAVTTAVLLVVALAMPVPYVRLSPGPTFDVIGERDGAPVIAIDGATTYPTTGQLDMTTVYERGGPRTGLTLMEAIAAWANPTDAVVPRELIFPDDATGDEVSKRNAMAFSSSESNAIAAAMKHLGLPVQDHVIASLVYEDAPATKVLEAGDRIVKVDDLTVTEPGQVAEYVRSQPVGTTLHFVIERDGTEQQVDITTAANPEDSSVSYLGIGVGTDYSADFGIDFVMKDVGGPSAGLVFALGIVDKLTQGDLLDGNHVAGTGTIDPDGTVGPIGGIRQKLAGARKSGAELFLMPRAHCAEAAGHVPDGLEVVPVDSLDDAVRAVELWTHGQPTDTCPAVTTALGQPSPPGAGA